MLISEYYIQQNRELHDNPNYGFSSSRWQFTVLDVKNKFHCKTVLDYGCGKGGLVDAIHCHGYDPAVEKYSHRPAPCDLVVCTDVLEHIEPDCLDHVLNDIFQLTNKISFIVVYTKPAEKFLPDGRNAHLIVKDGIWWKEKLENYFSILSYKINPRKTILLCSKEK